jgi:hypothetical protein
MRIIKKPVKVISTYIFALLLVVNLPLSAVAGAVAVDTQTTTTAPVSQSGPTLTTDAATTSTNQSTAQPTLVVQPDSTLSTAKPTIITPSTDASVVSVQQTSVTNTIGSQAQTGDATVAQNMTAGNATSGNATATATILNNINSTFSTANNQVTAGFVTNITGNVNGDIMLQPMIPQTLLGPGLSATSTVANITNTNNLTNNININATSGSATVVGNKTAGNATSGTANTVADVVNIINSLVAANQSFVGTINIYGNLNGDILIAPNFIPQLIASNGGSSTSQTSAPTTTTINSTDLQNIVNNVSLAAASGKAAVMDNTTAGNATSGNANTNVVIFNLSGHAVVASNSLLVFVNVLGKWVGVIVDAPVGATAAAIGNGVTSNAVIPPNLTIVSNNNNQITNNITLNSLSGNATVAANTLAGNAVSGNATSSANIANISNSQFGLTGWFGVLFINVFGNWYGSFGVNTAAGDPVNANSAGNSNTKVIEFVPKPNTGSSKVSVVGSSGSGSYTVTDNSNQSETGKVLGGTSNNTTKPTGYSTELTYPKTLNVALLAGSVFVTGISAAGIRRFFLTGAFAK